jgi:pyruvate carboxylase
MPGKVSAIAVRKGQPVRAGQHLFSLEAMKMETAVSSPLEGTVADVLVTVGASVDAGDLLVVLE